MNGKNILEVLVFHAKDQPVLGHSCIIDEDIKQA